MSPHELELMLFINKIFLSPSIFDKVMKWARSATANGYKFDAPSYSTLKKQMDYTFPNTIKWMVVLSNLKSYSYQMRLDHTSQWQCGTLRIPFELFAKSLQDPQIMMYFVCFPQRIYTDCGSHVYDKIPSADWFYEAFNNSPATESGMLWIWPGCLFVGIGHFDDSSNTDRLMKTSEHPFLHTKSDTRALSIIWLLDVGVSTTWSWGEWSWKVSIKSQVKWW